MAATEHNLVIGIDAGGTTIRIVIADAASGATLAQIQGPAQPDGGPETVGALLEQALSTGAVRAVCAGITKISRAGVGARWERELARLLPQAAVFVVPDFVVAFHGATGNGVGIVVVAGTGSVVYGEDGRGGSARVGGRGWEWGDEGSGAWLTGEMIRRTLRAGDGIEAATRLTNAVAETLGTREAGQIGEEARRRIEESGRGFLVPLALRLARENDGEARNLFVGAAGWLATQVKAAHARLVFSNGAPVSVALVGGLWEAGDLLRVPFAQVVARFLPHAQIIALRAAPVTGAALRAQSLIAPPQR